MRASRAKNSRSLQQANSRKAERDGVADRPNQQADREDQEPVWHEVHRILRGVGYALGSGLVALTLPSKPQRRIELPLGLARCIPVTMTAAGQPDTSPVQRRPYLASRPRTGDARTRA